MDNKPSKLNPSLIAGSAIALLSTVPILNMGNCLCCMWIVLGGALGAYLYYREFPPEIPFTTADGAIIGLLSGIFGALFGTLLGYMFTALGINQGYEFLQNMFESRGDLYPEIEELLEELRYGGELNTLFVFIGLLFSLILNSIFSTFGGIIGAAIFSKRVKTEKSNENSPTSTKINK